MFRLNLLFILWWRAHVFRSTSPLNFFLIYIYFLFIHIFYFWWEEGFYHFCFSVWWASMYWDSYKGWAYEPKARLKNKILHLKITSPIIHGKTYKFVRHFVFFLLFFVLFWNFGMHESGDTKGKKHLVYIY